MHYTWNNEQTLVDENGCHTRAGDQSMLSYVRPRYTYMEFNSGHPGMAALRLLHQNVGRAPHLNYNKVLYCTVAGFNCYPCLFPVANIPQNCEGFALRLLSSKRTASSQTTAPRFETVKLLRPRYAKEKPKHKPNITLFVLILVVVTACCPCVDLSTCTVYKQTLLVQRHPRL